MYYWNIHLWVPIHWLLPIAFISYFNYHSNWIPKSSIFQWNEHTCPFSTTVLHCLTHSRVSIQVKVPMLSDVLLPETAWLNRVAKGQSHMVVQYLWKLVSLPKSGTNLKNVNGSQLLRRGRLGRLRLEASPGNKLVISYLNKQARYDGTWV
jgi:hypothetical protein